MVLAMFSYSTHAALPEPAEAVQECQLNVGAGAQSKGFSQMLKDIQAVCGSEVKLCQIPSSGGLQNLTLLASKDIDLGMVQLDILQNMKDSDENLKNLQAVVPLNYNLLHVVTRVGGFTTSITKEGAKKFGGLMKGDPVVTNTTVSIAKFSDLKGKKIALVGSADLMGRTLERTLGYGMQFVTAKDDNDALAKLRAGQVHAVFSVTGWAKNGVFADLKNVEGQPALAFVPYDLTPSAPYLVVKKNYPNLGAYKISFLAVPSLLVSQKYRLTGANGKNVTALQACILRNLENLQEGSKFQPGWGDVQGPDTFGWPRHGVAK
jgi:TRAP-type uncharacterized transport system substrate-binding protein